MERIKKLYMKNPKELQEFIDELVKRVVDKYEKYIDFIILYGSAARGEFIKGSSDIDIVIQLNEKANTSLKKEILEIVSKEFWELNEKYKLEFEKVIQTNIIEKITPLYTPIFVFLPQDVDWINGKFHGHYKLISLITSEKSVFFSFKHEGLILYGRNIKEMIKVKWNRWDKIRMINLPFLLLNGALLIGIFQPYKAKEYVIKALTYAIINTIHIHERYDAITMKEKVNTFAKMIEEKDVKKIEKIIKYKSNIEKVSLLPLIKLTYPLLWRYWVKNILFLLKRGKKAKK